MIFPRSLVTVFLLVLPCLTFPAAGYTAPAVSSFARGLEFVAAGDYTDALDAFDTATGLEPSYFEAWNGKADVLNRQKNYVAALAASDRALAINSNYPQGWINHGYILYNLGRYDDELKAYEQAVELDPMNAEAWFNQGYALAAMGRYDEAIRSFDMVASIDPSYQNLGANRRLAEKSRDNTTPFFIRYAGWIVVAVVIVLGAGALFLIRRRTIR